MLSKRVIKPASLPEKADHASPTLPYVYPVWNRRKLGIRRCPRLDLVCQAAVRVVEERKSQY
jgi:hypothetical protein